MNSRIVGINLGVTSEHVTCISDGDEKPSKKTIRFSPIPRRAGQAMCLSKERK